MKIGYPCINNSLKVTTFKTFRLGSYSDERFKETVSYNLANLRNILEFNIRHDLKFFRIGSGLIPLASHPVCVFPWREYFKKEFSEIGEYIAKHGLRISMHPDQFTLINALGEEIISRSIKEIEYHTDVLDLFGLDPSHKVQIHVGGAYGDKEKSIARFISNYNKLSEKIKNRLVIENDERLFSLKDCLFISKQTGVPVILDTLHHKLNNNGESLAQAVNSAAKTWKNIDGVPMTDYSSQAPDKRTGAHTNSIDTEDFKKFLSAASGIDLDIMLEIKDKEKSALLAIEILNNNL